MDTKTDFIQQVIEMVLPPFGQFKHNNINRKINYHNKIIAIEDDYFMFLLIFPT